MHVTCIFGHVQPYLEMGDSRFHSTVGGGLEAAGRPLQSSPIAVLGSLRRIIYIYIDIYIDIYIYNLFIHI